MDQKELERFESWKLRVKKERERSERYRIRNLIIVQKAKKTGITVSDEEVEKYIKNMK